MLQKVKRPDGREVSFEYDALGRRISKIGNKKITRYIWDGNVILHEWSYDVEEEPKAFVDDDGKVVVEKEKVENVVMWVYANNGFMPIAKLINNEKYSIIHDYLGTPIQAYNENGEKIWERELDSYGNVRYGDNSFVPFLYQGQYYDSEIELLYNRFRYYDAEAGIYLSKDPIGLAGGIKLYNYVIDTNKFVDVLGLMANFPTNVDFTGHPDLFPITGSQKNIVKIKLQGDRGADCTQAFKEAGIKKVDADGYTWHHVHDLNGSGETTMQLVKTENS